MGRGPWPPGNSEWILRGGGQSRPSKATPSPRRPPSSLSDRNPPKAATSRVFLVGPGKSAFSSDVCGHHNCWMCFPMYVRRGSAVGLPLTPPSSFPSALCSGVCQRHPGGQLTGLTAAGGPAGPSVAGGSLPGWPRWLEPASALAALGRSLSGA